MAHEINSIQEDANAAYVYCNHLQAELIDTLQRQRAGDSDEKWALIQRAYTRLESAVARERELDSAAKAARVES